jgi:hypothetical protein
VNKEFHLSDLFFYNFDASLDTVNNYGGAVCVNNNQASLFASRSFSGECVAECGALFMQAYIQEI